MKTAASVALATSVAILFLATPHFALKDEEAGPYIELESMLTQLNDLDIDLVLTDQDLPLGTPGKDPQTSGIDFDRRYSNKLVIGWTLPGNHGDLVGEVWQLTDKHSFNESARVTMAGIQSSFLNLRGRMAKATAASGESDLTTRSWQLYYQRNLLSLERVELDWRLGIRFAEFDQEIRATYEDPLGFTNGLPIQEVLQFVSKSEALGPKFGFEGRIRLAKSGRVYLRTFMDLSFFTGDNERSYSSEVTRTDDPALPPGFFEPLFEIDRTRSETDEVSSNLLEFGVSLVIAFTKKFSGSLGWRVFNWEEQWEDIIVEGGVFQQNHLNTSFRDAGYSGPTLSLRYHF